MEYARVFFREIRRKSFTIAVECAIIIANLQEGRLFLSKEYMANRTQKKANPNQVMLILIMILAVLLVGVICLALILGTADMNRGENPTEAPSVPTTPNYTYPE